MEVVLYKNIRIRFAFAYYSNPAIGTGSKDLAEGFGYMTDGLEISSDHMYLFAEPHGGMKCRVVLKPNWLTPLIRIRNLFFKKTIPVVPAYEVTKRTRFEMSKIQVVTFDDGYDDSCYSFTEISAFEVNKDNRTRRIFNDHQILSPEELVRGKIVIYHHWHSGEERTIPEFMVVLEGPSDDELLNLPRFKGLFLYEDGSVWEFWPFLADCTVIPSPEGYYQNLSYLIDTGETMNEEAISFALSRKKQLPK